MLWNNNRCARTYTRTRAYFGPRPMHGPCAHRSYRTCRYTASSARLVQACQVTRIWPTSHAHTQTALRLTHAAKIRDHAQKTSMPRLVLPKVRVQTVQYCYCQQSFQRKGTQKEVVMLILMPVCSPVF